MRDGRTYRYRRYGAFEYDAVEGIFRLLPHAPYASCCLRRYSRPECCDTCTIASAHDDGLLTANSCWSARLYWLEHQLGRREWPTILGRIGRHARHRRSERAQRESRRCRVDYGCPNREKGPLFMSGVRRQSNPSPPAQAAGALLGISRWGTTPLPCPTTLRSDPARPASTVACASAAETLCFLSESSRSPCVSPVLLLTDVPFAMSCQ
ncbi:2OG-Fe dioxygenase family protein [Mesorhizobium sp. M1005]|uniref:hypothetical protein n=1 Tax=unclassified Mesorhizobium TaxID=325217 RepID=UPI0033386924